MKQKFLKKFTAFFLALAITATMIPATAFAEGPYGPDTDFTGLDDLAFSKITDKSVTLANLGKTAPATATTKAKFTNLTKNFEYTIVANTTESPAPADLPAVQALTGKWQPGVSFTKTNDGKALAPNTEYVIFVKPKGATYTGVERIDVKTLQTALAPAKAALYQPNKALPYYSLTDTTVKLKAPATGKPKKTDTTELSIEYLFLEQSAVKETTAAKYNVSGWFTPTSGVIEKTNLTPGTKYTVLARYQTGDATSKNFAKVSAFTFTTVDTGGKTKTLDKDTTTVDKYAAVPVTVELGNKFFDFANDSVRTWTANAVIAVNPLVSRLFPEKGVKYQWYTVSDSLVITKIAKATTNSFTLGDDGVKAAKICVVVTATGYQPLTLTLDNPTLAPPPTPATLPSDWAVGISSRTKTVDEITTTILTAELNEVPTDKLALVSYQWVTETDDDGTTTYDEIPGETESTYEFDPDDYDTVTVITVKVTVDGYAGTIMPAQPHTVTPTTS